jgi:lysozyme
MLDGIDVSDWQKRINWPEVLNSGIAFAFVKASQGYDRSPYAYLDPSWDRNSKALRSSSLPWGAYHFALPSSSPTKQAEFFAPLARLGTLPPALDIERHASLPDAELDDWAAEFLTTLQNLTGRTPIVYTNVDIGDRLKSAGKYPLWIANPGNRGAPNPAARPSMPKHWKTWLFWQFSWTGSIPGISKRVDLDRFAGSLQDLQALCSGAAPVATIEERLSRLERAVFGA